MCQIRNKHILRQIVIYDVGFWGCDINTIIIDIRKLCANFRCRLRYAPVRCDL